MQGHAKQVGMGILAAIFFALAVPSAWSQLNIGDDFHVTLAGDAGFGFTSVMDGMNTDSVGFNFNGNLTGYYYNPSFLSFRVNPYYGQSRFNSNYNSLATAKGINTAVNLFAGGHTPIEFSFEKAYDYEGQFNIPGSPLGYETLGNGQAFSITGGLLFPDYPTVQVSYGQSSSDYRVLADNLTGGGNSRLFSVSSGYELAGFRLGALYSNMRMTQEIPLVFGFTLRPEETNTVSTATFTASRQLFNWASFNTSFSHTYLNTDFGSTLNDNSYNTLNSAVTMAPTRRLNMGFNFNWSSNLSAQTLNGLLSSGAIGPVAPAAAVTAGSSTTAAASSTATAPTLLRTETVTDYLDYGGRVSYALAKNLFADGSVEHRSQQLSGGFESSGTTSQAGIGYTHSLLGGTIGGHYGFFWYENLGSTHGNGHSLTGSYSRSIEGWNMSVGGQYSQAIATALIGITQTSFGGNLSAARRLSKDWGVSFSAALSKSSLNGQTGTDVMASNYTASLSARRFSVSGGYSKNNGSSFPLAGGLVPVAGPGQVLLPGLVLYRGDSYSIGAGWTPKRKLNINGSFSKMQYHTDNLATSSDSRITRLDVKSEYHFRQMSFTGGYTYLSQGLGLTFANPSAIHVIFFGVTRHFDIF